MEGLILIPMVFMFASTNLPWQATRFCGGVRLLLKTGQRDVMRSSGKEDTCWYDRSRIHLRVGIR